MSVDTLPEVRWDATGLVPAIVQDVHTRQVLMLGYMSAESLRLTQDSGLVWFFSRSRQRLWQKGETSGNVLRVKRIYADCDGDALLVEAEPGGPTCHTGASGCFFNVLEGQSEEDPAVTEHVLLETLRARYRERPEGSYATRLFDGGVDRIAKKVGEEASEVIIAAMHADSAELVREMADLWFHSYVLLVQARVDPSEVWAELARRRK